MEYEIVNAIFHDQIVCFFWSCQLLWVARICDWSLCLTAASSSKRLDDGWGSGGYERRVHLDTGSGRCERKGKPRILKVKKNTTR